MVSGKSTALMTGIEEAVVNLVKKSGVADKILFFQEEGLRKRNMVRFERRKEIDETTRERQKLCLRVKRSQAYRLSDELGVYACIP